jgi:tetratricopeptide (TPR) repeat protein
VKNARIFKKFENRNPKELLYFSLIIYFYFIFSMIRNSELINKIRSNPAKALFIIFSCFIFLNSAEAQTFKIKSAYFSNIDSLVLDLDSSSSDSGEPELIRSAEGFYIIKGAQLQKSCPRVLSNADFIINLENRSEGSFFKPSEYLYLEARSRKTSNNASLSGKLLIDSIAYELRLSQQKVNSENKLTSGVSLNQISLYEISTEKTATENFIDKLDSKTVNALLKQTDFQKQVFSTMDSASLYRLGSALLDLGQVEQATSAFRESLKLDPKNLSAKLALAKHTKNEEEKIQRFLETIDSEALVSISESWFKAAQESSNSELIDSAKLPYQLAILKEPWNPELRLSYAKQLEKAGPNYYSEATQRYLEAAAIFKKQYLAGESSLEAGLRSSAESLIKLLSHQGRFQDANHYALSYLNLGFKNFSDGSPTKAIIREFERKQNPFQRSPS